MKKTGIFLLLIMLFAAANTTYGQSCCKKPEGMQALALNKSFKEAHLAPLPLAYAPENGNMINFPTIGEGGEGHAFFVPADHDSHKVLFIFHEWWGLNDYIKREAVEWQKALGGDVAVYAVDLYDGKVAQTPDEAGALMSHLDAKRAEAIIKGLIREIGPDKEIGTLGWCMGGSWSFTAALLAGKQTKGCVMYYGFPEKDAKRIKQLQTNVLYIRGEKDDFIKKEDVATFEKQVKATGKTFTLESFDAVHAFANPSNPKYDMGAATAAKKLTFAFLQKELLGK